MVAFTQVISNFIYASGMVMAGLRTVAFVNIWTEGENNRCTTTETLTKFINIIIKKRMTLIITICFLYPFLLGCSILLTELSVY